MQRREIEPPVRNASQAAVLLNSIVLLTMPQAGWVLLVEVREKGSLSLGFVGALVYCQGKNGQDAFHHVG